MSYHDDRLRRALSVYATGLACPNGVLTNLYSDSFSGYANGAQPGDPPWFKYNAPDGFAQSVVITAETNLGNKVLRGSYLAAGVNTRACAAFMWDAGYAGFDAGPCGVYTEAIWDSVANGGGGVVCNGGLAIGVADPVTTDKIIWVFGNGGAANVYRIQDWRGGTTLCFTPSSSPVVGDTCRLALYRNGAYGMKLEAFINGVSVGSVTSATQPFIMLTHAKPKNIGTFFGMEGGGFTAGVNSFSLRAWKGGVY